MSESKAQRGQSNRRRADPPERPADRAPRAGDRALSANSSSTSGPPPLARSFIVTTPSRSARRATSAVPTSASGHSPLAGPRAPVGCAARLRATTRGDDCEPPLPPQAPGERDIGRPPGEDFRLGAPCRGGLPRRRDASSRRHGEPLGAVHAHVLQCARDVLPIEAGRQVYLASAIVKTSGSVGPLQAATALLRRRVNGHLDRG